MIRTVWEAAPRLSLVHDVGVNGPLTAIEEMAAWSGNEAEVDDPGVNVRFVVAARELPNWAEPIGRVR